jgi:ribonuclease BN (tRNA processing enzyme)
MNLGLRFLGCGAAHAAELGCSAAVVERDGTPLLLIDCGADTLNRHLETYRDLPRAVFVTHVHMDHVAGLERLFFRTYFDPARRGQVAMYAHAALVPHLQARLADYPEMVAEGGANFWDAFRLVPCSRGFWHAGLWFDVFATRHHAPLSSFGLAVRGAFAYTGDTRPIPEALAHYAPEPALIAHDCALQGNPSHSGVDDLEREYTKEQRRRFVLYHYGGAAEGAALAARGYRVARPGEVLALPAPVAGAMLHEPAGVSA